MRTKALLCMAATAAMLTTSAVAQNVYSVNVVGYVNVSLTAGNLHFLSLPFENITGDYTIGSNVILPTDGSQDFSFLYSWNDSAQAWNDAVLYLAGWLDPSVVVSNGVGFFLQPAASGTITFVGQVAQSTTAPITYSTPAAGLTGLGNKIPVSTNFPGADAGQDFDFIYTWNESGQAWNDAILYIGGGWLTDSADGPMLDPGKALFYQNGAATPYSWNRSFTVAP